MFPAQTIYFLTVLSMFPLLNTVKKYIIWAGNIVSGSSELRVLIMPVGSANVTRQYYIKIYQ